MQKVERLNFIRNVTGFKFQGRVSEIPKGDLSRAIKYHELIKNLQEM